MPKIKMPVIKLANADIQYISLVPRGATRIPFRIIKRENPAMINLDLSRIFKGGDTQPEVVLAGIAIQKSDEVKEIELKFTDLKFDITKKQEDDDGVIIYKTGDSIENVTPIRLSDNMIALVTGLDVESVPGSMITDVSKEEGFLPSIYDAASLTYEKIIETIIKSDTDKALADGIDSVLKDFKDYTGIIAAAIPPALFLADTQVAEIIAKAANKLTNTTVDTGSETNEFGEGSSAEEESDTTDNTEGNTSDVNPKKCKPGMKNMDVTKKPGKCKKGDDDEEDTNEESVTKAALDSILKAIEKNTKQVEVVSKSFDDLSDRVNSIEELTQKNDKIIKKTVIGSMDDGDDTDSGKNVIPSRKSDKSDINGIFDTAFNQNVRKRAYRR